MIHGRQFGGNSLAAGLDRYRFVLQDHQEETLLASLEVVYEAAGQQVVQRSAGSVEVHGRLGVAVVGDLLGGHEENSAGDIAGKRETAECEVSG